MTLTPARQKSPLARAITDGLEPKNWIFGVAILIGWHAGRLPGIGWGLFAAVFCAVVPIAFIKFGQRRGYWGDRHVRRRQDRLLLIPGIMASVVTGMILMDVLGAPREMIALVTAMLATLIAILAITTAWKISVHTAVSSGAIVMLAMAYGAWPLLLCPLVAIVGWSRVELKDHTLLQVCAGTVLGAVVAGVVFSIFR